MLLLVFYGLAPEPLFFKASDFALVACDLVFGAGRTRCGSLAARRTIGLKSFLSAARPVAIGNRAARFALVDCQRRRADQNKQGQTIPSMECLRD